MAEALHVEGVTKTYDRAKLPVLNELSFDAQQGEFIVLVGPSGCGKSTMLRSIAGLELVDSGRIIIGKREVTNLVPKDRNIAMVFQDYALYPHKNVYENIAFGLRIRKLAGDEIDRRVQEAAKKLNLTPYLQRRPAALSGGQRQRVAIGRAIVRKPDVFLFDEPLSNLDAKLRGTMRITIGRLHKELGATIVYVTHDQVEAMTLADKIIVLEGGRIRQMGTPLELYYHPKNRFVAQFIGSPPMNMIRGELIDRDGLTFVSDNGLEFKIPVDKLPKLTADAKPGLKVDWGIRAENVRVASDVDNHADDVRLQASTLVVEPLGPTTSIYCTVKNHDLHVTLNEPHRPRVGETIGLVWRSKHFYLFNADETGAALTR